MPLRPRAVCGSDLDGDGGLRGMVAEPSEEVRDLGTLTDAVRRYIYGNQVKTN